VEKTSRGDVGAAALKKIGWQLIPFLCLLYIVEEFGCYLGAPLRRPTAAAVATPA
jgi:hypothetical protein